MDVGKELVKSLKQFVEDLESDKPLPCTTLVKKSECCVHMQEHAPDMRKIPKALQQLDWKTIKDDQLWEDGSQILVVVPVCVARKDEWYYELSLLTIHCDVEYFSVTCQGESWGWDLTDVDFYIDLHAGDDHG